MSDKEDKDKNIKIDKIFNNSYNTGEYDYQNFKFDKSDVEYGCNDLDNFSIIEFRNEIYEIFKNSKYYAVYGLKTKTYKKDDVCDILRMFINESKTIKNIVFLDAFLEIVECFRLNYKDAFLSLLPKEKDMVLDELNKRHNIFKNKKIKKLF